LSLAKRLYRARWRFRAEAYLNRHEGLCAANQELALSRARWSKPATK
jgi:hypothetical protein